LNRPQLRRVPLPSFRTVESKMPVKRRTNKYHGAITEHQAAWLRGDRKDGFFFSGNHDFMKQELWDSHGDTEHFHWETGMWFPVPIDEIHLAEFRS
jgi:hypothetical protein